MAKDVWLECPVRIQKCPCDKDDFSSIFMRLVERLTNEELRLVVIVARQIWFGEIMLFSRENSSL